MVFERKKRSNHYVKSVHIRRFSGPYFPAFGLYFVSLHIREIKPNMDTFQAANVRLVKKMKATKVREKRKALNINKGK